MNKAFLKFLKQTATVYRKTLSAKDASGEIGVTFVLLSENIKCLVTQISGFQIVKYQGLGVQAQYEGFFRYEADISLGDKIIVEGITYYVTFQDTNVSATWKYHKICALKLEVNENAI